LAFYCLHKYTKNYSHVQVSKLNLGSLFSDSK
jgi:hypothetical protein